jgi:hypothetical protein
MTTPDQPTTRTTEEIWDRYAWHATRADVDRVLHFTHWIPRSRGFTNTFLNDNWPGWNLERLIKVFDAAGIRRKPTSRRASAPHGGYCHWKVKEIHFNGRHEFHVEWNDLTEDDGIFHGQATEKSGPLISSWFTARPSAGLPPITKRSVDLAQFLTRDDD